MGKDTYIQWCDSTNNVQMGCEGCELLKGKSKGDIICYAAVLTARYEGLKGWPETFTRPKLFMERLPKMISWPDLTGKPRLLKPWLDNYPRIIFLNDMGDTFTKGLPDDWFSEVLEPIRNSTHQYLVLTKWPKRFQEFALRHPIPANMWVGTSPTSQKTLFRAKMLTGSPIPFLSIEPLWGNMDLSPIIENIRWIIIGGESGLRPTPCEYEYIENVINQCRAAGVPVFVKQLGSYLAKKHNLKDRSGGDWDEWPEHLRIREMPKIMNS